MKGKKRDLSFMAAGVTVSELLHKISGKTILENLSDLILNGKKENMGNSDFNELIRSYIYELVRSAYLTDDDLAFVCERLTRKNIYAKLLDAFTSDENDILTDTSSLESLKKKQRKINEIDHNIAMFLGRFEKQLIPKSKAKNNYWQFINDHSAAELVDIISKYVQIEQPKKLAWSYNYDRAELSEIFEMDETNIDREVRDIYNLLMFRKTYGAPAGLITSVLFDEIGRSEKEDQFYSYLSDLSKEEHHNFFIKINEKFNNGDEKELLAILKAGIELKSHEQTRDYYKSMDLI